MISCYMKDWDTVLFEQRNVDFHQMAENDQFMHFERSSIHIDLNMQKWRRVNEDKVL